MTDRRKGRVRENVFRCMSFVQIRRIVHDLIGIHHLRQPKMNHRLIADSLAAQDSSCHFSLQSSPRIRPDLKFVTGDVQSACGCEFKPPLAIRFQLDGHPFLLNELISDHPQRDTRSFSVWENALQTDEDLSRSATPPGRRQRVSRVGNKE